MLITISLESLKLPNPDKSNENLYMAVWGVSIAIDDIVHFPDSTVKVIISSQLKEATEKRSINTFINLMNSLNLFMITHALLCSLI